MLYRNRRLPKGFVDVLKSLSKLEFAQNERFYQYSAQVEQNLEIL